MEIYQVLCRPTWTCPGMLIFTDWNNKVGEYIVATQTHPYNTLTTQRFEEGEINWDEVKEDFAYIKSINSLSEAVSPSKMLGFEKFLSKKNMTLSEFNKEDIWFKASLEAEYFG